MKVFKEEQRFTQTWLIALLLISGLIPIVLIAIEYFDENSKMTTNEFLLTLGAVIFSLSFIFFFKLNTRIDETGIHYQFFPFHFSFRLIKWNEIEKVYIRKYDPIGDYGGWGLKGGALWNRKKGTAINVSGDIGIQLELKNGKKLLIGTKKENEVKRVLNNYKTKYNENKNNS